MYLGIRDKKMKGNWQVYQKFERSIMKNLNVHKFF